MSYLSPFVKMCLCKSILRHVNVYVNGMLFHVIPCLHCFPLPWGWDRTENGMPLPLKQSPLTGHADAASYAPLQCLAATLWNMNWLQVDLIPKFIMASGDLAQRWDEKGLAGPQCIDIALHSGIGIQAERRRRREIREILWAEVKILFWRQECPVTWSSVLRLLKIFESLAASALGEDIRVLLWCSRFVTFWLWCICCAYAIGIPISSAAYCITHPHTHH